LLMATLRSHLKISAKAQPFIPNVTPLITTR
jgi:hypothetical protein